MFPCCSNIWAALWFAAGTEAGKLVAWLRLGRNGQFRAIWPPLPTAWLPHKDQKKKWQIADKSFFFKLLPKVTVTNISSKLATKSKITSPGFLYITVTNFLHDRHQRMSIHTQNPHPSFLSKD